MVLVPASRVKNRNLFIVSGDIAIGRKFINQVLLIAVLILLLFKYCYVPITDTGNVLASAFHLNDNHLLLTSSSIYYYKHQLSNYTSGICKCATCHRACVVGR